MHAPWPIPEKTGDERLSFEEFGRLGMVLLLHILGGNEKLPLMVVLEFTSDNVPLSGTITAVEPSVLLDLRRFENV
jgi:hypothetical protein